MERIELRMAYQWTCQCGAVNVVLPEVPDLCDDDLESIYRELHELEPWQEMPEDWWKFGVACSPEYVTCEKCDVQFSTYEEGELDENL
ncbi:hypothetical protein [Kordiimonas sp.]|uniref:hypothetical protein n=1 Tax=Kordiimonas sp. TaxID=1970157 RepID=UPI003A8E8589